MALAHRIKAQLFEGTDLELVKLLQGLRGVRKQIQTGVGIAIGLDGTFFDAIVKPMRGDTKRRGNLRDRERAGETSGMRLAAGHKELVLEPNAFHRAR